MHRSLLALACGLALFVASSHGQAQVAMDASGMGLVIVGYDSRTCDSSLEGAISYNSGTSKVQICASSGNSCPNIGDTCGDGSYFIGDIGAEPIYATNESFESNESWNDGNTNYITTGVTSLTDGVGNTATLVTADSNDGIAGVQPHEAAIYCDGLSAHGHSDWYLPAQDELDLFWNGGTPVANVDETGISPAGWYWSSSEVNNGNTWRQRFNDGSQSSDNKIYVIAVRCVRNSSTPPTGYSWTNWGE